MSQQKVDKFETGVAYSEHAQREQDLLSKIEASENNYVIGRGGSSIHVKPIAPVMWGPKKENIEIYASSPNGDECSVEITQEAAKNLAMILIRALTPHEY